MSTNSALSDLPDETKIDANTKYLLSGNHLTAIIFTLRQLWRGANVNVPLHGGGIFKSENGDAGFDLRVSLKNGDSNSPNPWPFKVYNTSTGTTGQVQINGGDGLVASLSPNNGGFSGIALVNGSRNDLSTGTPPVYPQLAVSGNGVVYVKADLITISGFTYATAVNVLFAAALPSGDSTSPPAFGIKLLATITNYSSSNGKVSFNINDANGPQGINTVSVCGRNVMFF